MKRATEADLVRFFSMTRRRGKCLIWTGALRQGHRPYGRFTFDGKARSAHRWIYEQVHGKLRDDIDVMHKCDNPSCVEIAHLTIGTRSDNIQDAVRKGRVLDGERHPGAKLTAWMVREIRRLYATGGYSQRELAEQFGVSASTISSVVNGVSYALL